MEFTQEDRDALLEVHSISKRLDKSVFGNGKPGLLDRMVRVEADVENNGKKLDDHICDFQKPKQWPAVVSAIIAIIMCALTIHTVIGG